MVAKKRNRLRNKVAAASAQLTTNAVSSSEPNELLLTDDNDNTGDFDNQSFLHQPRETKKSKQMTKQQSFLSKLKEKSSKNDPAFAGISKSAIRRRKRNMREELKPKMDDLLKSLGEEEDLKEHVTQQTEDNEDKPKSKVTKFVQSKDIPTKESGYVRIRKNEPNIRNQRGAKALTIKETNRLAEVLANKSFQQNTFSALRDVIRMQNR